MSWSKEQFEAFCTAAGINPGKALKEGKVDLRPRSEQVVGQVKGSTLSNIKQAQLRKKKIPNAFGHNAKIQDSERESGSQVALEQEVCGQDHGMGGVNAPFRIHVIGHRVRPIDPDNFAAGCKSLIDGIVASGLLPGDDWKTVQMSFSQRKVSAWSQEGTQIILEVDNAT